MRQTVTCCKNTSAPTWQKGKCFHKNIAIIPKQVSATYPQHCDNTKLRPGPLNPNQASASYPQHCGNTKLRPVPLNPNQASASYPQHCDNTKLRPSASIFRVNSEPESYPSPSQAKSRASGFTFFQSSLRSHGRSERGQIRRVVSAIFFSNHIHIFNEFTYDYICVSTVLYT